jgi:hypothetical protein
MFTVILSFLKRERDRERCPGHNIDPMLCPGHNIRLMLCPGHNIRSMFMKPSFL